MRCQPLTLSVCLALAYCLPILAQEPTADKLAVSPQAIVLKQYRQPQSLQVLSTNRAGFSQDLRSVAKLTSADPKIASIDEQGFVHPQASGTTQVTIQAAGQTVTVPVTVTLPEREPTVSFRHEIMPLLSKAGCNQGACHGYSLGKNGFKLSLRGSDPELDYPSIVREFFGRRVSGVTPEKSMLLTKALGETAHEGGARFRRGSLSHQLLARWLAEQTPDDLADPARVVSVKMVPEKLVLQPGQKHRLQLFAEYQDGTLRDVTRLGIFSANNTQYADVDEEGLVAAGETGETVVVGRFERKFSATGVLVLDPSPKFQPTPVPTAHLVDKHVVEKLNHLKITPSALADDAAFLRRIYLDVIGVQPKPEEVQAFAENKDPQKREKLVDTLFERPEFVDHWSLKWGDLLQNSRNSASSPSVYLFREFIRNAVASNMKMDEFAKKLVLAQGGAGDNPASVYYTISKDTNETVERVTQVFCGVRMLCARCHPHPMENWTQADYFGLASFFNQVTVRADGRAPNVPNSKLVQLNLQVGSANNPRSNKPQPAKFLGGDEPTLPVGKDRRPAYAAWLTSGKNPFFARGLVNRYWSYFFHRGIIEPVDDVRSTNPPINPALLDALTQDFIEHQFDVRHLIKRIVTSATYQRSTVPTVDNKTDEQNFSHAIPRRIPAEALLDSLIQATGVPENFGGAPAGFRAAQLPDGNVTNDFLRLFGKPQRLDACECERDNTSNMLQALHFINGASILGRVQNASSRATVLSKQKIPDTQLVTELYSWSLCRKPTEKELTVGLEFLKKYGDKRTDAAQDLFWALLNSKDFLLVH